MTRAGECVDHNLTVVLNAFGERGLEAAVEEVLPRFILCRLVLVRGGDPNYGVTLPVHTILADDLAAIVDGVRVGVWRAEGDNMLFASANWLMRARAVTLTGATA